MMSLARVTTSLRGFCKVVLCAHSRIYARKLTLSIIGSTKSGLRRNLARCEMSP
jgi:hypothetical protein